MVIDAKVMLFSDKRKLFSQKVSLITIFTSKLLSLGNKNFFILYFAHLFVTLRQKKQTTK